MPQLAGHEPNDTGHQQVPPNNMKDGKPIIYCLFFWGRGLQQSVETDALKSRARVRHPRPRELVFVQIQGTGSHQFS